VISCASDQRTVMASKEVEWSTGYRVEAQRFDKRCWFWYNLATEEFEMLP
jgi:hypothetical protein